MVTVATQTYITQLNLQGELEEETYLWEYACSTLYYYFLNIKVYSFKKFKDNHEHVLFFIFPFDIQIIYVHSTKRFIHIHL